MKIIFKIINILLAVLSPFFLLYLIRTGFFLGGYLLDNYCNTFNYLAICNLQPLSSGGKEYYFHELLFIWLGVIIVLALFFLIYFKYLRKVFINMEGATKIENH